MNNPNKTKLTQSEAARAAGVSHTTIWRAIRRGKLSAERGADGMVQIDRSELLRVYPQANIGVAQGGAPGNAANNAKHREFAALRTLVEELQADKRRLLSELDRAHEERSRAADERARLLSMLEAKDRLLTDARSKRSWWQRWRKPE